MASDKHSMDIMPVDLDRRIEVARNQTEGLEKLMKSLLKEGVDFGTVKGVPRPFLHQPGAQSLALIFNFRAEFEMEEKVIDLNQDHAFISYDYKCRLYNKDTNVYLGDGVGAANNYEKKFRYHKGKQVEDPLGQQNDIKKRAKKRAFVDAVLNITGASRLFTTEDDGDAYTRQKNENFSGDPGEVVSPLKKHKGKKLKELPTEDLQFLSVKAYKEEVQIAATKVLENRIQEELDDEEKGSTGSADAGTTPVVLIDEKVGKKIFEYLKSEDERAQKVSRKVAEEFLKKQGFNRFEQIKELTKSQGDNLLGLIEAEINLGSGGN